MALPLLTWQQTAWVPVTATDATTYLDAVQAVFAATTTWELDATSTNWREFKPTAGSNIPDCRVLVFFGALPHANSMKGELTTPATNQAYIGYSVDAGATAPGDPTTGVPYSGKRWSGFVSFDKPATRTTDRIYGVISEEIVALVVNKSTADTWWGAGIVGAMGVAHVNDSEADERIWMSFGAGGQAGASILTTWWSVGGGANGGLLTSFSSAPDASYNQLILADPLSTSAIYRSYRHEGYPNADANTLVSSSGRTVVKPLSFTIEATPKRHGGHFRQMGLGPNALARAVFQDGGLNDVGYALVPSFTTPYPSLVFSAGVI